MDLMMLSVSILTVVVTAGGGYFLLQLIWPGYNLEISVSKAFQQADYDKIIDLTENKHLSLHSFQVFVYAGRARVLKSQYEDALLWFESALVRHSLNNTDRVFLETEIADIYVQLNRLEKAEMHYRAALSLQPENVLANYKLAFLFYQTGRMELCRRILRPVLKKNPMLIDSRRLYAECMASLGRYNKAIRHFGILARAGEKIVSYNYARTLKELKIYERAHDVLLKLLESNIDPEHNEQIILDLAELCVLMKRFHEGLGIIEKYLYQVVSKNAQMHLQYIKANLFYKRGDQMLALQEYNNLYLKNPSFKDLASIIEQFGSMLHYPFLYNYFTANEALFEKVISRMVSPGIMIIRRTSQYYLCLIDKTAYIFYRELYTMPSRLMEDIDLVISRICPDIDQLQVWSLNGISERYSMAGIDYLLTLKSDEVFIVCLKNAVELLDNIGQYGEAKFVSGFQDIPQIIPNTSNDLELEKLLEISDADMILNDKFLEQAFEK